MIYLLRFPCLCLLRHKRLEWLFVASVLLAGSLAACSSQDRSLRESTVRMLQVAEDAYSGTTTSDTTDKSNETDAALQELDSLRLGKIEPQPASDAALLDVPLSLRFNRAVALAEASLIRQIWLEEVDTPQDDATAWLPVSWTVLGNLVTGTAALRPEQLYRWHFPEAIKVAGEAFFRTASASSWQAITLLDSTPVNGARGVAPNGILQVRFNRPVRQPEFVLTCGGSVVEGVQYLGYRSGMLWQSAAGTALPPLADCVWLVNPGGRAVTFVTRVQLGELLLLAVNVDPQQDWSCSDGTCTSFCGQAGGGTVSTSDEYLVLVNGSDRWIDLRDVEIVMEDSTPESWVPDSGSQLCFDHEGRLEALAPGEIVVLGNPPGSMNNELDILLYHESVLTDWLSIANGSVLSTEHQWRSPHGGKAQGSQAEIHRRYSTVTGSFWTISQASPGRW